MKSGKFENWFGLSKESFKSCLKYALILGATQVLLGILSFMAFEYISAFALIIFAVINFAATFTIVFFALKSILNAFPKENKLYLALYIFGISLIVFFVAASLIAGQLSNPRGTVIQLLATALAIKMTKTPKQKLKEEK
ncbi:MAG: hypothetical protein ABH986_06370 [archaeon]